MTAASDLAAVRGLLEQGEDRRVPLRDQLYRLYLAVLFGAVAYVVVVMPIGAAALSVVATDLFAQWAPGVLSVLGFGLLVAGARFGSWAGPVLVSRPDADWLLTSPLPRRELLRPHLVVGLLAGTGLGACTGLAVGLAAAYLTPAAPWAVIAATVAGWAALGALAAAVSWYVESSPRAPAVVLHASPLGLLVALALVVGGLGTHLAVWTGPWGWASLPLLQVADQAVAGDWAGGALVASLAVGGVAAAIRAVESVHHEQLASRVCATTCSVPRTSSTPCGESDPRGAPPASRGPPVGSPPAATVTSPGGGVARRGRPGSTADQAGVGRHARRRRGRHRDG